MHAYIHTYIYSVSQSVATIHIYIPSAHIPANLLDNLLFILHLARVFGAKFLRVRLGIPANCIMFNSILRLRVPPIFWFTFWHCVNVCMYVCMYVKTRKHTQSAFQTCNQP